jgi:hypothetical protein
MNLQIRIVAIADNGQQQVYEIASLQRTELKMETLGLTLAEGKTILCEIQRVVVERQVAECLEPYRHCSACGQPQHGKGQHDLPMRTVFGKMTIPSPRIVYCDCQPHETKSFSPLAQLLPERTTPEMLFLETKWSALMSYGVTSDLLQEVLPMDSPLHASTIREHVFRVAERMEKELGEEQWCFIEGCERDWNKLPPPNGPLTVGIDGGYVRGRNKEHFEVIAGKSLLAFRRDEEQDEELSGKCFAFVQTYDEKPKRRLFEVLRSQGMSMNQQVEFLSDGGEDVRNVQLYLNPEAEHLLDWFHLTMRLTVLLQTAKGVPEKIQDEDGEERELRPQALKLLESVKWYLWHGNAFQALQKLEYLEMDLEGASYSSKNENIRKLLKGVEELHTYVGRNQNFLPNYGERYRNGERIASGFVESAVNQVVSKRMIKHQQMQWTHRGAHLLLQIRTRVLNEEWEDTFRRWYPDFRPHAEEPVLQAAA